MHRTTGSNFCFVLDHKDGRFLFLSTVQDL